MSAEPRAASSRMPYIDVLRAVAILTVVFRHLPPELGVSFGRLHEWGGRGVDLFFILSGFLIGSTCLDRVQRYEDQRARQAGAYWLLRTARIFPLYFTLLAVFAVGLPIINPDVTHVIRNFTLPFVTFTSNYFAQGTLELGIYWSLAIEEQFYLAVGLLVLATSWRRDTLAAAFVGLALAAIAVTLVVRWDLFQRNATQALEDKWYVFALFHSTLARMDQLATGLLTAVVAPAFNRTAFARAPRWARTSGWLAIGAAVAVLVFFPHRPVFGFFFLGLVFAGAVLMAQRPPVQTMTLGRVERLAFSPLTSIGKLSFGLYLFHPLTRPGAQVLADWLSLAHEGMSAATAFLLIWLALTWALAWVSFRFFEDPILQVARRRATALLARTKASPQAVVEAGAPADARSPG